MTTESRFSVLFRKYVEASATQEERLEFLAQANQEAYQTELAQLVDEEIKLKGTGHSLNPEEQDEILASIYNAAPQEAVAQAPVFHLWKRIAVVAAAVAAIVFGIWFYTSRQAIVNRKSQIVTQTDLAPGKNTATLILANGKTINLSDAKTGVVIGANALTYNDGSAVERGNPELVSGSQAAALTITTPRGGQYQIRLPDGTKVWLNAASSLTYTMLLNERGGVRQVELSGEAYFEVFRNKKQPFVVKSKKMELTVLGTHFNVNAYEDEHSTKTTLLEGSVRVASLSSQQIANRESNIVNLLPNQQATLTSNSKINVQDVVAEDAIAWKNGYFMFNNESLESVMEQIARWYNIKVIYEDPEVKTGTVFGTISRFEQVSKVLRMLERADVVRFTVEGNTVKIKKKK